MNRAMLTLGGVATFETLASSMFVSALPTAISCHGCYVGRLWAQQAAFYWLQISFQSSF